MLQLGHPQSPEGVDDAHVDLDALPPLGKRRVEQTPIAAAGVAASLTTQAVARSSGIAGGGRSISHTAQPADKEGRRRVEQMELERWLRLLRKPQCSGEAVAIARCMVQRTDMMSA